MTATRSVVALPVYAVATIVVMLGINGLLLRFDGVPGGATVRTGTMTVTSCVPSVVHLGIVSWCGGPVAWDAEVRTGGVLLEHAPRYHVTSPAPLHGEVAVVTRARQRGSQAVEDVFLASAPVGRLTWVWFVAVPAWLAVGLLVLHLVGRQVLARRAAECGPDQA